MERLGNDFATTLAAAITTVGQTAILVTSGTGSPSVNFRIRIDDELCLVTSKGSGLDWTIQRGLEGTTAATHLVSADVAHVVTIGGLDLYALERGLAYREQLTDTGDTLSVPAGSKMVVVGSIDIKGSLDVAGSVESI